MTRPIMISILLLVCTVQVYSSDTNRVAELLAQITGKTNSCEGLSDVYAHLRIGSSIADIPEQSVETDPDKRRVNFAGPSGDLGTNYILRIDYVHECAFFFFYESNRVVNIVWSNTFPSQLEPKRTKRTKRTFGDYTIPPVGISQTEPVGPLIFIEGE